MSNRAEKSSGVLSATAGGAAVLALVTLCGCAGSAPGINRPTVGQTAAESATANASVSASTRSLNFLDELESRPLVAHDDALTAALLLGTGQTGAGYDERVAAATKLGYVDPGFNKPAREASTVGEVSQMLVRVERSGQKPSVEDALTIMIGRGAVPPSAKPYQGVTGAQLVSMLGATQDAMASAGVQRTPWPQVSPAVAPARVAAPVAPAASLAPAAPAQAAATPSASDTDREQVSVKRIGFKGRPEPLPEVPAAADKPAPTPQPRAAAPSTPAPAAAPAHPPAPAPATPSTPGPIVDSVPQSAAPASIEPAQPQAMAATTALPAIAANIKPVAPTASTTNVLPTIPVATPVSAPKPQTSWVRAKPLKSDAQSSVSGN